MFPPSAIATKHLKDLKGLEIGGSAHNSFKLNTLNVDYTDDLNTIYKQEEKRLAGTPMKVDIIASGDNIPVPDKSYDFVISSHVLEHFVNPIKALREWKRIAKQFIFIIVPKRDALPTDACRPLSYISELIKRDEENLSPKDLGYNNDDEHFTIFSPELLVDLSKHLNLQIVEARSSDDKVGNGLLILYRIID